MPDNNSVQPGLDRRVFVEHQSSQPANAQRYPTIEIGAMNLDHTEPFANTEWRVTSIETPATTTHAVFRPSSPPIVFGVDGALQADLATQLIHAIERCHIPTNSCQSSDLRPQVNGLDKLVAVLGPDRHFLRGWHIDQAGSRSSHPRLRLRVGSRPLLSIRSITRSREFFQSSPRCRTVFSISDARRRFSAVRGQLGTRKTLRAHDIHFHPEK